MKKWEKVSRSEINPTKNYPSIRFCLSRFTRGEISSLRNRIAMVSLAFRRESIFDSSFLRILVILKNISEIIDSK